MTLVDDIERQDRLHSNDSGAVASRRRSARAATDRPTRSRAAQRAIDRRTKRLASEETPTRRESRSVAVGLAPHPQRMSLSERMSRVPFVVPVLLVLALGLGLSLWLSTKAAQDSYQISIARQQNQELLDRSDSLKRTFESGNSASELADAASSLGLVVAQNPARMVIGPDGKPRIVGDPEPATGKRMPTINPDTDPHPTTIDPSKVDDSVGLTGAHTGTAPTTTAQSGTPSPTATPAPQTAPGPAAPVVAAPTPAPNVLPSAAATPGNQPRAANSAETR